MLWLLWNEGANSKSSKKKEEKPQKRINRLSIEIQDILNHHSFPSSPLTITCTKSEGFLKQIKI